MTGRLRHIITSPDPAVRNQSLDAFCRSATLAELLRGMRRPGSIPPPQRKSLRTRPRAVFSLRHSPVSSARASRASNARGLDSVQGLRPSAATPLRGGASRNFSPRKTADGPSDAISSALAAAYYRLGIQTLADQVRRSVRSVRGNQWMFRMGHPLDHPLRLRPELLQRGADGSYPILRERTPVRMDLTHSALERYFFPRHGLSRRRAGAECLR